MQIEILHDEQGHLRLFEASLRDATRRRARRRRHPSRQPWDNTQPPLGRLQALIVITRWMGWGRPGAEGRRLYILLPLPRSLCPSSTGRRYRFHSA